MLTAGTAVWCYRRQITSSASFVSSRVGRAPFFSDPSVSHGDTVEAELAGAEAAAGAADESV
jgi:hypothetical protein